MSPIGRIAVFSFLSISVVGYLVLMAWGLADRVPVTAQSGVHLIGLPAPGFLVTLFEGGEYSLADRARQPAVINFWASWCGPCRDEALPLERTWRAYGNRGISFIGINTQDGEPDARSYLKEFGITYPNGHDHDGTISIDYGIVGMPATFFVNRDGVLIGRWVGAIPEDELVDWVEGLLQDPEEN